MLTLIFFLQKLRFAMKLFIFIFLAYLHILLHLFVLLCLSFAHTFIASLFLVLSLVNDIAVRLSLYNKQIFLRICSNISVSLSNATSTDNSILSFALNKNTTFYVQYSAKLFYFFFPFLIPMAFHFVLSLAQFSLSDVAERAYLHCDLDCWGFPSETFIAQCFP